jgi:hypothetical protein
MADRLPPITGWAALFALAGFRHEPLPRDAMLKGALEAEYAMPEREGMRPCGIAGCKQPHRHGWLVKLEDATRSHVGNICGKRHFKDWHRMRSTYRAAQRSAGITQARVEARVELAAFLDALPPWESDDTRAARALLREFDERLPKAARETLMSRARESDDVVSERRLQTATEVMLDPRNKDKKNPQPRYGVFPVGRLVGLKAIARTHRVDVILDARLPELVRRLLSLLDALSLPADTYRAGIRDVNSLRAELDASLANLARFFAADNLALLPKVQGVRNAGVSGVRLEAGPPRRLVVM